MGISNGFLENLDYLEPRPIYNTQAGGSDSARLFSAGSTALLPPLPAHAPARRPHCLIPFYIRHHFSAISVRNTASLSEVIQPDADPLTPSAQLVALPTATTAAVVPGVASNLLAAFDMTTTSDNDAAPTPNHSLIASLLPTIRPPARGRPPAPTVRRR